MAVLQSDFILNSIDPDIIVPDNIAVHFPPIFPSDVASKQYVDVSYPTGKTRGYGAIYKGVLNFSVPNTPLYNAVGADSVAFSVNRIGTIVNLNIDGLNTTTTAAGTQLVATGLPEEYWPSPSLTTDTSGMVTTNSFYISLIGAVWDIGSVGVGSDGIITITPNRYQWALAEACAWPAGTLCYNTWRGYPYLTSY